METINLTEHSHGSGCGCKIAPADLEKILHGIKTEGSNKLLVGNSSKDDAAVYDLGNNQALISTTDFFTPIVNDAYTFGRIAAANAISDVYAMGGTPLLALAILGWPIEKLGTNIAKQVIEGGRATCAEAGIPLAGGHSIDSPEPIFGLAVNGICNTQNLKLNNTAQEGDLLYLTKPIGVGILAAAQKKKKLLPEHIGIAEKHMMTLNKIGSQLGSLNFVHALTDVTGFGLLGHLIEMAEGSNLAAELNYNNIPFINGLETYIKNYCFPDNNYRNWNGYEKKTNGITAESLITLCDPQTNGGLLIAVNKNENRKLEELLIENNLGEYAKPIGKFMKADTSETRVYIN